MDELVGHTGSCERTEQALWLRSGVSERGDVSATILFPSCVPITRAFHVLSCHMLNYRSVNDSADKMFHDV